MPQPIYTSPGGFAVYDFSHSQYSTYKGCPKRFEIERVRGWRRKPGAALEFGKAIEESVKRFYRDGVRDAVESFESQWELWNPVALETSLKQTSATPEEIDKLLKSVLAIEYPHGEAWQSMDLAGRGLMKTFVSKWESFPLRNPVFPEFKNPMKVRDSNTGNDYQTIPDAIDEDANGPFICDMKALGVLLDESVPGLVINDLQLRTQAAATMVFRVALMNFCRKPKRGDALAPERIFEEVRAGLGGMRYQTVSHVAMFAARETNGLTIDAAGEFLRIPNPKEITKEFNQLCKDDSSLKVLAQEITNTLAALNGPQYKIQWVEGTMTQEHAFEAVREEMSVVPLIQQGWFPRRGGVRFPDNDCTWCSARGLCMEEIFGKKPEYDAITEAELVRWDAKMMDGLD
jgi:hypothetical protein